MIKLVNTLGNIVESSHKRIVSEAISKRMMQTLLNKFQPDTDDSPETIQKYINALTDLNNPYHQIKGIFRGIVMVT